jgi:hypothetical protein
VLKHAPATTADVVVREEIKISRPALVVNNKHVRSNRIYALNEGGRYHQEGQLAVIKQTYDVMGECTWDPAMMDANSLPQGMAN